ncbi:hypothetical protein BGM26_02915 [Bacillus sp. FJAT-29790]|uniref:hypothetical protein n=1 Tax=Bacillus sp. FJAT-29790 TaxID=1895002 RepID=UPI001C215252|nr:hypothetical protein [Bacillus sp. FJAT-29790]MBU8877944.1 hypothetical protein [Bacillus sp. FJAT-29790]
MKNEKMQFPIELKKLDQLAYKKLYDNARNIYDRSQDHTVNGQREEYKNTKCLLGANIPQIRDNMWKDDRLKQEMRKAMMVYLINGQAIEYVPEVHRTTKDYDFNVEILNKNVHSQEGSMQSAVIMRETTEKYEVIGIEVFSSKSQLAKRLGVSKNLIYTCEAGKIIKIDDIVIKFQNVIKDKSKLIG